MKKRFHLVPGIFFSIGVFLSLNVQTFAQTVRLATFEYPPLFHTSKLGTFSGTVGETVKYLCERAGLTCEIEVLPFKRAYQKLDNNLVDGLITIKVDEFRDCCVHTDWETPWIAGLFTHRSLVDTPQIPDDMIGEKVIVVAGMRSPYAFMPKLDQWKEKKDISVFTAQNVYSATRMFLTKRADLLWGSEDFYWYFDKQSGEKTFSFLPLIVRPIVVWVQKDKKHIRERLDLAYMQMLHDEQLDHKRLLIPEIMEKHYKDAPFEVPPHDE